MDNSNNKYHDISLLSEKIQSIVSGKPSLMERWALLIFLVIFLILIAMSWIIRYPDTIIARGSLSAENGPKEIVLQTSGHLEKLFVQNGELVQKGQILGWMECLGSHEELLDLSIRLDSGTELLRNSLFDKASNLYVKDYDSLGDIQQKFQEFKSAWQSFNDYLVNGFYLRKKRQLLQDIQSLDSTRKSIEGQKQFTIQDSKLSEESFKTTKRLYDENVISKEELRQATSKYLTKEIALEGADAAILTADRQRMEIIKEVDQLDHDASTQKAIFQEAMASLRSVVNDWKRKYIVQAPTSGQISYAFPIQEFNYLQEGRLLGYVSPAHSRYFLQANLTQTNFIRLDTGLRVNVRFDAYPYQEVGVVPGKLEYISDIASDSGILAIIRFENGLETNNHRMIPYKNGLKADALIITRNMRLLQRLYYNLTKSYTINQ